MVFDEAHNIDNVCIEALSVSLRQHTLRGARANIARLESVRTFDTFKRLGVGAAVLFALGSV